ncbi:MAG: SLBB domain-containing protein [bacterium]
MKNNIIIIVKGKVMIKKLVILIMVFIFNSSLMSLEIKKKFGAPEVDLEKESKNFLRKRGIIEEDISKEKILPFGFNIFKESITTFEPLENCPVDLNYLIGPDDEIIVNLWGGVELNYTFKVNREGIIVIQNIGEICVLGMTLEKLKLYLIQKFSQVYSGLKNGTTYLGVSIGKLKSIKVFVIGNVKSPGGYTLKSMATVFNSLYNAGGPSDKGSLRKIILYRNNEIIKTIDFYNYLLKGEKKEDERLQNGDTVFVPLSSLLVTVQGKITKPAIYELKKEENLKNLIDMAGGLLPEADRKIVQIDRIFLNQERKIINIDLDVFLEEKLFNGDVISFFPISEIRKNVVNIRGYILKPSVYELTEKMKVSDLIEKSGGILKDAYLEKADIIRTNEDLTQKIIPFSLEKSLKNDEKENYLLQKLDEVIIYSIHTFKKTEYVQIEGEVKNTGQYTLISGMTLQNLIVLAGGLKDSAYTLKAEISRRNNDKKVEIILVEIGNDYNKLSQNNDFLLKDYDIIYIRKKPEWEKQREVVITGEVNFPGTYSLKDDKEQIWSIIKRAGNLKETAYLEGIIFTRKKINDIPLWLNEKNLKKDNIVLEDEDIIFIPRKISVVKVEGEVMNPQSILFKKGKDVNYYIKKTGEFTVKADKNRIIIVFANGETVKARRWFFPQKPNMGSKIIVPSKKEKDVK